MTNGRTIHAQDAHIMSWLKSPESEGYWIGESLEWEKPIDTSEWHNTGSNGSALAEWVRKVGTRSAVANVMRDHVTPYRIMLDLWVGASIAEEGIPFATLDEAKAYADKFLSA